MRDPPMRQTVRWHPFDDVGTVQEAALRRVLDAAAVAIAARGRFDIVLAGGETPRGLYARLALQRLDGSGWQVWFGDERCLPADDAGRNSRMAADAWLARAPIPASQVHPIPAELGALAAAEAYAAALSDVGDFDCVLLGLGEDGHTASLFPGHPDGRPIGNGRDVDVLPVFAAPKPPPERVSLGAARLSRTRTALFLVAGAAKRDAVRRWRAGEPLPAAAITPPGGVDVLIERSLLE